MAVALVLVVALLQVLVLAIGCCLRWCLKRGEVVSGEQEEPKQRRPRRLKTD